MKEPITDGTAETYKVASYKMTEDPKDLYDRTCFQAFVRRENERIGHDKWRYATVTSKKGEIKH
ncbi:hypothetical protein ACTXT7_007122 [Hymenolepis weldensis]